MQIKNLSDLQKFLGTLNEDQLKKPVKYWGEGKAGELGFAEILDEDYYSSPSGEGCEPKSTHVNQRIRDDSFKF